MLYRMLRPALFRLNPERAHALAIAAIKAAPARRPAPQSRLLATEVAGLAFPHPLGLAAGFDKNALAPDALLGLGFGFVEVGTITPRPQSGNPRPRLFRLVEDHALINRLGFNNEGAEAARARLAARERSGAGVVGVNIGANAASADRVADYAIMAGIMAPHADYLTINVSSPNTRALRDLQDAGALAGLLDAVIEARGGAARTKAEPPLFLKVAPDLEHRQVDAIARLAIDRKLGALIVSNTTVSRPPLRSHHSGETGGLSGKPLKSLALEQLRAFRRATGGALPLIGVGGITSAVDAFGRIRAGASLVQLYTAMVYQGPALARRYTSGLAYLMEREGFASIAEAVGSE